MYEVPTAASVSDEVNPDADEASLVMPFYLIIDVSGSMSGDMGDLNRSMSELVHELTADAIVDDTALLSVITFNNVGDQTVALDRPSRVQLPTLMASGGTSFRAAWEEYSRAWSKDFASLKAAGHKVYRPVVFFLTDGASQDQHRDYFDRNLGKESGLATWPYVVAVGFRDAREKDLEGLAYPRNGDKLGRWFLARNGVGIKQVLKEIRDLIAQSIISSGLSASTGTPQILIAQAPAGTMLQGEAVDQAF